MIETINRTINNAVILVVVYMSTIKATKELHQVI